MSKVLENSLLEFPTVLRGKKVLLATESFGPINGVSKTTLNLVEYLRSNGVDVAVVAPHIGTHEKIPTTDRREIRLQGYPLPYNPELSVVYPVRLSRLYSRTFGGRPDLIYLASPASLGFQIIFQLMQQQPSAVVPVLLNFQTDLSGYCEILFPAPLDQWAVWVFRSVQGYLFRHSIVKVIFYPSTFVRRYLAKARVQPEKMMTLRRGVNAALFNPSQRSEKYRAQVAPNGELILVCVSRLAPEKGFDFLANVAQQLDKRGISFKLLVVGGNSNQNVVNEIKSLFGNLIQEEKVLFTGFLRGDALAQAYASGDIFLHCSITETFGLVVLESMASGTPVIARDEGGPSEIVVDNESGFLIPPSDLHQFVSKILQLQDVQLRQKMGLVSRNMAEKATWEAINHTVAVRMAAELQQEIVRKQNATIENISPHIPIYSWLLLHPRLREVFVKWVVDFKLAGCIWVISAIWGGLILTWVLAQVTLFVKSRSRAT